MRTHERSHSHTDYWWQPSGDVYDDLIADRVHVPTGSESGYPEQILRLVGVRHERNPGDTKKFRLIWPGPLARRTIEQSRSMQRSIHLDAKSAPR